jgi:probable rRNA maturation factor
MKISFFHENVSYEIRRKRDLRRWIGDTIIREGKIGGELNFILCDDDYLYNLNFKYLKHKTLTDILTFPADLGNDLLNGDIFISLPRVEENALKFNEKTEDELHRVMVHGILHLIGYNDLSTQEKVEMKVKENFYLALFRTS